MSQRRGLPVLPGECPSSAGGPPCQDRRRSSDNAARRCFDEQRPRLLGLAYRMLGAVSEAEAVLDVTRERWSAGYLPEVQDPETALTTLVTRLAMDRMRLLRAARQGYSGFWLPEPVPCRSRDDEPLSLELLAAMERLSPLERAAYVLRVVLARPYPEVAAVLGRRLPAVRQLVRRARVHLGDAATPDEADRTRHEVVVRRLAAACRSASLGALVDVLGPDVVLLSDEGRRGPVRAGPVVGRDRVGTVGRRRPEAAPPWRAGRRRDLQRRDRGGPPDVPGPGMRPCGPGRHGPRGVDPAGGQPAEADGPQREGRADGHRLSSTTAPTRRNPADAMMSRCWRSTSGPSRGASGPPSGGCGSASVMTSLWWSAGSPTPTAGTRPAGFRSDPRPTSPHTWLGVPTPGTDEPAPVGFAVVDGLTQERRSVAALWVAPVVRSDGVGRALALDVVDRHDGPWTVAFQHDNAGAGRFWRRFADSAFGPGGWTEEQRDVPGVPGAPPDHWIESR